MLSHTTFHHKNLIHMSRLLLIKLNLAITFCQYFLSFFSYCYFFLKNWVVNTKYKLTQFKSLGFWVKIGGITTKAQ